MVGGGGGGCVIIFGKFVGGSELICLCWRGVVANAKPEVILG